MQLRRAGVEHVRSFDDGVEERPFSSMSAVSFDGVSSHPCASASAENTPGIVVPEVCGVVLVAGQRHSKGRQHLLVGEKVQGLRVGEHAIEIEDNGADHPDRRKLKGDSGCAEL